jgi:hypothetical protein
VVGRRTHEDRRSKHGAEEVCAARNREHHEREPELGREAESEDREAPDAGPEGHCEALASRVRRPAGEQRAHERARVWRGEEVADGLRPAAELLLCKRGKERARHAEDHRVRVDEEDPDERLPTLEEAEPVDDRPQARALSLVAGRNPRQEPDRDERRGVGREIDPVRRRDADGRDQDPAERRPGDGGEAPVDGLQRDGRRDLVVWNKARRERGQRRPAEAEDGHGSRLESEQGPRSRMREERIREEERGDDHHPDLRPQQDGAAVAGVRDRASPQRDDEQREESREAE